MSEKNFWKQIRTNMDRGKYWLEATRHEDTVNVGVADVSYVSLRGNHGWIELKYIPAWPKRESTLVRIQHYTPAQKRFLRRKGEAGGFAWLFIKVGKNKDSEYLLYNWDEAQEVGELTRANMYYLASVAYPDPCNDDRTIWQVVGEKLNSPF